MRDPRELYTTVPEAWAAVRGRGLVLVHLLEGYVDAGSVNRLVSEQLLEHCAHEAVAVFDVDQLHDYRARRPAMTFDTSRWMDATMPELVLHRLTDAEGSDFLLLAGPEPDSQWVRTIEAVLGLAEELGVSQLATAGGVPMGVPHTRPLLVTRHGTDPDLEHDNPTFVDRVSLPGSFGALLELRAGERGLRAGGAVAHVPHYLAQGSFAPAALRVAELIAETTGLALPLGDLGDTSEATFAALANEMSEDEELARMVSGLEEHYDELAGAARRVPSADEIGRVVERFLAERADGEGEDS